jgi:hypothetical protein
MSDDKEAPSTLGAGPLIIVKGGTTPSSYDRAREEERHQTEQGRLHQDKQMRSAAIGDRMTSEGFVSSRLHSLRMLDGGSPRLVLKYMNRDGTVRQYGTSEVVELPDGDALFIMVCPRCLERGEPHGRCQVIVRRSHRKWEIDVKKMGEFVELVDPYGKPMHVRLIGTVSSDEILRCANFNCNWAVRIENSEVREV